MPFKFQRKFKMKKEIYAGLAFLAVILILAFVGFKFTGRVVDTSSGLVGLYGFENNANDNSGNGNNGVLVGGTSFDTGKIGNAVSLDGVSDYIDVSDSSSLNIRDEITISAWIKPNEIKKYSYIAEKDAFSLFLYSSRLRMDLKINGIAYHAISSYNQAAAGEWVYVIGVYDNSWADKKIKLYVNGQEGSYQTRDTLPSGQIDANNNLFRISVPGESSFNGLIDELRIYSRALSSEEIMSLYNGTIPPESCVEDWSCTDWSACVNNSQTKTCTDANNCGTEVDKPAETQSCSLTSNCSDGTSYSACSVTKPLYCQDGILIEDCSLCGCNVNETCNSAGSCIVMIPELQECYGCEYEDNCLDYGFRMKVDGVSSYCADTKNFELQKQDNESCENNHECLSNECSDGVCVGLIGEIRGQTSLLWRILCTLFHPIDDTERQACIDEHSSYN